MANNKKFVVKNGLTTSNIEFKDDINNGTNTITASMLSTDVLSFSGDSGQLFSITDSLSGTIFSVNDISGIPSFEVDDDGTIRLAEFAGNVLIGTATDDGANKLQLTGDAKITGNFETTGNISVTGTVDGRDVAADGTKLDGIESGATADQTAAEILTAVKTVDGAGSGLDADLLDGQQGSYYLDYNNLSNTPGSGAARTEEFPTVTDGSAAVTMNGNYAIDKIDVFLNGAKMKGGTDYTVSGTTLTFSENLQTGDVVALYVYNTDVLITADWNDLNDVSVTGASANDLVRYNGSSWVIAPASIDSSGNLSISGTVDGRDVATDGTKLDGIEAGATADQTASEILTAIKTVDGSGSGLDADTVDGIEAAAITQSGDTVALTGDVTGSTTVATDGAISIATTIAANSVALGTDTTGNYVATVTGTANEVEVTGSGSESAAVTVGLPSDVTVSNNLTVGGYIAGPSTFTIDPAGVGDNTGTVVIAGDLQVGGTTITVNSQEVAVGDKVITLGSDATADTQNNGAGIKVYRPDSFDASFLWDETNDEWDLNTNFNISGNLSISGTVDGRDIATDGTKLDGIESGATADQTASEILTAIKTVDGSGSGLDADLLDGQHGSYYYSPANAPDPTLTLTGDVTGSATFTNLGNATLTATVANDSHTHDGRYYTESEVNTFINRSYVSNHSATNLAVGWYTIAQNVGDRAVARFALWDTDSGDHQAVIFYASHHFGSDASNTLTVLDNSYYSGNPFRYIRIKDANTYDGAALQVYIDDASNNVNIAIVGDDVQTSGWDIVDFLADATAPSLVSNWANFGERSKIDLNQIAQGGFATTGPIYADGDTTQYRVFNDNYHPNADTWTTARTITLGGDLSGSVSIDGSTNVTLNATVADDSHNHVISNIDGLQTELDAKLNSSSYTASDVLTKIKTVDGTGSGLDADLLDGINSGSFVRSDVNDTVSGQLTFNRSVVFNNNSTDTYPKLDNNNSNRMWLDGFVAIPKGYSGGDGLSFRFDDSESAYIFDRFSGVSYSVTAGTDPGSTIIEKLFGYTNNYFNLNSYKDVSNNFEFTVSGLSLSNSSNSQWAPYVLFHSAGGNVTTIIVEGLEGDGTTWTELFNGDAQDVIAPLGFTSFSTGILKGLKFKFQGITGNSYLKMVGVTSRTTESFTWQMLKTGGDFYGDISGKSSGTENWSITQAGAASFLTVDGRDVAADGTKLDGIESGATADQTASEILTAIKTVDGAGSGLDADTVDGVEASSFLRSDAADTKTSGDLNFSDNIKAVFGAGSDLQIYHDGTNSRIADVGTGELRLQGTNLRLWSASGENYLTAVENGAVSLYYDNSTKIATTSTGVDVTGEVVSDSATINGNTSIGSTSEFTTGGTARLTVAGGNLAIGSSNSDLMYIRRQGNGEFAFQTFYNGNNGNIQLNPYGGYVGIGTTSPETPLTVASNSVSSAASGFRLKSNSGTYSLVNIAERSTDGARLHMYDAGVEKIAFYTDGTANHISAGNLGIGTASPDYLLDIAAPGNDGVAISSGNALIGKDGDGGDTQLIYWSGGAGSVVYYGRNTLGGVVNQHEFRTNGTTKLTITEAGNVGIGTNSPANKLHVVGGNTRLDSNLFVIQSGQTYTDPSSGLTGIGIRNTGTSPSYNAFGIQTGAGAAFQVRNNGDIIVLNDATIGNDLTVTGNLTVSGTTTTVNTETINLADNIIVLNSNEAGTPSQNAGIEVERGTSTNVQLRWNETNDKWEVTEDGAAYSNILTTADEGSGNGIDADTVDGVEASSFLRSDAADTKTSGDLSFSDDVKAVFGASNDLEIWHQSSNSNSIIKENGGGSLSIQSNGTYIDFWDTLNSNTMLKANIGGNVELYHNGNKKLETTSTGIAVTGNISVTGTVDGRDIATDGTKLDGIEAGATADQTASEILTAIKTVDGAGSGLDADLLDGQQGSYYQNAGNLNAGTLPGARLTEALGTYQIDPLISTNQGRYSSLSVPTMSMAAIVDPAIENKMQFQVPSSVEVSTDNGSTWSALSISSNDLKDLVSGTGTGGGITISNQSYTQLRLTWNHSDYNYGYVFLNYLHYYTSPKRNTIAPTIEARDFTSQTFSTIESGNAHSGWPTHIWMPHNSIAFTNSSGRNDVVRITWDLTWNTSYTDSIQITKLNWYGTYPVANHNRVSSWDRDGNMSVTNGLSVTDNITVGGTVDGRDVAADGTKLDGIESGATADQTASEILTAIKTVDGSGSGLDADLLAGVQSVNYARRDTTNDFASTQRILSGAQVNHAFETSASIATYRSDAPTWRLWQPNSSGAQITSVDGAQVELAYNSGKRLETTSAGVTVSGDITVSGTVDGRDIATDGTKLDGIESGATADQTASEILTAIKTVDGSGSGLDADTIDGVEGSSFLRSDAADTATGLITLNGGLVVSGASTAIISRGADSETVFQSTNESASNANQFYIQHNLGNVNIGNSRGNINFNAGTLQYGGNTVLTEASTQSKYLRSDTNDDFSGTLNYTPDTGTILSVDGQAILQRMTASGAITIGHDDAVIIAGGDTSDVLNTNINNANETIFLGAEGGLVIYAFPNNDTTWTNRKTLSFDGANGLDMNSVFAVDINGNLSAATKSFVIDHPTKEGMKLRHGSLEGPENGVYVRGRITNSNTIELPEYWLGLVDEDSITVQLTAIGTQQNTWVKKIVNNTVVIEADSEIDCFYMINAERKDVKRFEVEYEI